MQLSHLHSGIGRTSDSSRSLSVTAHMAKVGDRRITLAWWDWDHGCLRAAPEDFRTLPVATFPAKHGGTTAKGGHRGRLAGAEMGLEGKGQLQ